MARIIVHESLTVANGKRIPSEGTKGNVFVMEEALCHDTFFFLCARWVGWHHLKVYPEDVKLGSGNFEVTDGIVMISLKRSNDGWPDVYTLENLREQLEFRPVRLRLAA